VAADRLEAERRQAAAPAQEGDLAGATSAMADAKTASPSQRGAPGAGRQQPGGEGRGGGSGQRQVAEVQ
jgi:hypothetical protein